jgi:hypothetical protein
MLSQFESQGLTINEVVDSATRLVDTTGSLLSKVSYRAKNKWDADETPYLGYLVGFL